MDRQIKGVDSTIVKDLVALAYDPAPEARGRLAGAVGDLVAGGLSEDQAGLVSQILMTLLGEVTADIRRALSERLASEPDAPHDVITFLASDEISVAEPVLLLSEVLQDDDLIALIERHGPEHWRCMAGRAGMPRRVSERLVRKDDPETMLGLLNNMQIELSKASIEVIARRSRACERLQAPLMQRDEITGDLAFRMFWWVAAEVRSQIMHRFPEAAARTDQALEVALEEAFDRDAMNRDVTPEMVHLARRLDEAGRLNIQMMLNTLRRRRMPLFSAMLAQKTGLEARNVHRMVFTHRPEILVALVRSIGVSKSEFATIFLLSRGGRPGEKIVDPGELTRVLGLFEKLSGLDARAIVESLRKKMAH